MARYDLLPDVIRQVSVSAKETKDLIARADMVRTQLTKAGLTTALGGSLAKGTLVKKRVQDIDIFILFEDESAMRNLERTLSQIDFGGELKKVHGSRDYFQLLFDTVQIELIPTVVVENPLDAKNVTDVSLSHVAYVTQMIKKHPELADDIRLAKAFCFAQDCYGAESYIRGFSGYSLEVLIIYFGGFLNFLKKVGKKRVIDPERFFKNEKDVLFSLNTAKTQSPLIVVDPTYQYRNITAGLSAETFARFRTSAAAFLKSPSADFFVKTPLDVSTLYARAQQKKASLYRVTVASDRQEGDIAGTKCRKFFDFFIAELVRYQQTVFEQRFEYCGAGSTACGYVILRETPQILIRGPPTTMTAAALRFKKEHRDAFVKGNYLWHKQTVSIERIFSGANRVKKEMGAWGVLIEKHGYT